MAIRKVVILRSARGENFGLGRKTWQVFGRLVPEGVKKARAFAFEHQDLLTGCHVFVTSPLIRAQQTLFEIMKALGASQEAFDEYIPTQDIWTHVPEGYISDNPNETMRSLANLRRPFAFAESLKLFSFLSGIVEEMENDNETTAVMISHKGPIDFLFARLRFMMGEQNAFDDMVDLGFCEGFVVTFKDGKLLDINQIRNPSTSQV